MPQGDYIFYNDGEGHIRQVPRDKVGTFKKYFPKAFRASEEELSGIESQRAAQSEREGRTKITVPRVSQIDTNAIQGQISLPESAPISEVAKDVMNVHRYDPAISFRAKYGAYKEQPELFRDQEADITQTQLTKEAQAQLKSVPKENIYIPGSPTIGQPGFTTTRTSKKRKDEELESLQDFLTNTPQGRGFVELDEQRKKQLDEYDQQLVQQISELEKEVERAKREDYLRKIKERARGEGIEIPKDFGERDIEKAGKLMGIKPSDDIILAEENLSELKKQQAAVQDVKEGRSDISQFFREFGRRIPGALPTIASGGITELDKAIQNQFFKKKPGELATRSENLLSEYATIHQLDRSIAQDIAQGTVGSLEFMSQFAVAGGAVSGITKGIGKRILTEGAKKAVKGAGKTVKIAGKEISEALLQTAIMPSTLANAVENNAENPGSFLDAYANSYLSNLVEVGSERVGAFIPDFQMKFLPESVQKLRRATGIQGAAGEFLEEQIATAGHAILGDQQAQWSDLVDPRQQLITAGVVGIIQLPYASINTAGYASAKYKNVKQKQSINKAYTQNIENMKKVFGNEAEGVQRWVDGIIDESFQSDEKSYLFPAIVSNIANSEDFDETEKDALIKYTLSSVAKNGMEKGKKEIIQQTQAEAQDVARQVINPETNSIIMAKVPEMDQPVLIQGNVVLKDDGTVDTSKSGEVYYTDANGKRKVIDARFIEIVENVPADQAMQEITTAKTVQTINSLANEEVRAYTPGETIRFTTDGTTNLVGQIQSVDQDGNYQVVVDGIPKPMMIEPRMIINEDNLTGVDNGVQVDYQDQNGNIVSGTVDDMSLRGNGVIIIDGKEVPSESVIGVHQETIKTSQITPEGEGIPTEQIQQTVRKESEAQAKSQITPEDEEAEKQRFMQSLPIIQTGQNKGRIDRAKMTPEQNIRFFEYQYGKEKAVEASRKMSENLKKQIEKEQKKLDNDPFNFEQTELVDQLKNQLKTYQDYAFSQMQAETEKRMQEDQKTSIVESREQRKTEIAKEEAGRTGEAGSAVKERWDAAEKIEGIEDVITLANAEKISGRYILTTAQALSPSHDIERNFAKTIGFPINELGNTVNDRDYEHDKTAQVIVEQRANNYDERAVQTPVVVSKEGVVISGNDRTMAGQLAAKKGTDKAYVDYITKYADRWGFTPEMVQSIKSPRIVFVPDADLPYNTETFAKFNAEEKKTQSTIERAIKSSKSVSKDIVIPIANVIDRFKNLTDFYNDTQATQDVIQILTQNKVVQTNELPRLLDNDVFSAEGKSFLETIMLGAVLQEQALREVDYMRFARQTLMRIMPQLMRNASLKEYTLIEELNNAIHLLYDANKAGSKIKLYLSQTKLFELSPKEVYEEVEKTLAFLLENAKDTEIRTIFESYNKEAVLIESGQQNMFEGVLSKPDLLKIILNRYGQTDINQQTGPSPKRDGQGERDRSGRAAERSAEPTEGQTGQEIEAEAAKVDTNPTEAQKEAGNYKKGHVNVAGFDISIEQPKGSVRSGTDNTGKEWSVTMNNHYGYIKRTQGKDGDQIDVFLGNDPNSRYVFVVDQVNPDGSFDEHKVMLGFDSMEEAKKAYLSNYEKGWGGLGSITIVELEDFRKWLDTPDRRIKPFAEYKQIQETKHETETTKIKSEVKSGFESQWNKLTKGIKAGTFSEMYAIKPDGIEYTNYNGEKIFIPKKLAEQVYTIKNKYTPIITDLKTGQTINHAKYGEIDTVVISRINKNKKGDIASITVNSNINPDFKYKIDPLDIAVKDKITLGDIEEAWRNIFLYPSSYNKYTIHTAEKVLPLLNESKAGMSLTEQKPEGDEAVFEPQATQLRINWDENVGNVPAKRNEGFASDVKTKEVQKKAGYDATIDNRLTAMERVLTNQGVINFVGEPLTGPAKITGANDVAFLFRNLESAASENVFMVFVNDKGEYNVLYHSTGTTFSSLIDYKTIAPLVKEFGATKMFFVHNHPSGNLTPSDADYYALRRIKTIGEMLNIDVAPGIIINLDSGKYTEFKDNEDYVFAGEDKISTTHERPDKPKVGTPVPVDVYTFDRQILYTPSSEKAKIMSSRDVAEFLSKQKRGAVNKMHVMILDRGNNINRYFLIDETINKSKLIKLLLEEVGKHGEAVVLASNSEIKNIPDIKSKLDKVGISLLDVLQIKQDDDILNNYKSWQDEGLIREEQAIYEQPLFRSIDEAGFYSTVEDALENIQQDKGTAEQFRSMLLKNGAKQAEMDWMGWDDQFPDATKKISKSDIQDWINQNRIEVKEVEKDERAVEIDKRLSELDALINLDDTVTPEDRVKYEREYDKLNTEYEQIGGIANITRYPKWQEPGGKNYRELLLTMPYKEPSLLYSVRENNGRWEVINDKTGKIATIESSKDVADEAAKFFTERDLEEITGEKLPKKKIFKSSHYDEPNILAHVRFNDREVNGERVLFLEEIQSDWAQIGRNEGFKSERAVNNKKSEIAKIESEIDKVVNEARKMGIPVGASSSQWEDFQNGNFKTAEYYKLENQLNGVRNVSDYERIQSEIDALSQRQIEIGNKRNELIKERERLESELEQEVQLFESYNSVPDMPFKNTDQWVNLVLRRMIRYAAENGYDRIAWTTGQQQADRYDLSKQVDSIVYTLDEGIVRIYPKFDPTPIEKRFNNQSELADIVGKDIADKIYSKEGTKTGNGDNRELKGLDLKVGGEGMKAFYDNIIPNAARKLGKPFGSEVETIEIPGLGKQQSIPVTDKMRETVSQGMPLFSFSPISEETDQRLISASTPKEKMRIVSDMVDEIEKKLRKSTETVVLENQANVFNTLRILGADENEIREAENASAILKGVYFNGVVLINADAMRSGKDVLDTWVHENLHSWMSKKQDLLLPLENQIDSEFLNENLKGAYRKLNKQRKVEELIAYSAENLFSGRKINVPEVRQVITPVLNKYLDYVTRGEFSQRSADRRRGRQPDEIPLSDYPGSREEGTGAPQRGERAGIGQEENADLLSGNRGVPDEIALQFRAVSDVAEEIGSKMPEDLRKEYDVKYDRFFTRFREAWVDTFIPVKEFLDLLRDNGVEIADYNDFYKQATHLQGKNDAQLNLFKNNYQHPITLAINELEKKGLSYRDIENYVFAKHGIERNEYMRNRDIRKWESKNPKATILEKSLFIDTLPKDYAGLTALEEEIGPAQEYIDGFEQKAGEELPRNLWTAINNATHWTLNFQYKTGMISKDTLDHLTSMYQYYVPLRGHDKDTAEDRWYYTVDMGTFFTSPLIKAKGRRSRAESPFAYIEQMAHSAIVQGNKNTLKQTFLRLAQKDTKGLMSATKTWTVNIGTKEEPIWEQQFAPYDEDINRYLDNQRIFEEKMRQLQKDGMAYQGKAKLDIGNLFIKPRQAAQHELQVYQNGVSHTVYINANPEIARSINGANRQDISRQMGFFSNVMRNMAANFTTRNPLFILTNFSRDYLYSTSMLLAKETPAYAWRFQRNIIPALGALQRYERGKVDLSKKADQYLYEYIMNGGKTGFSHIFELDRAAKALEREAKGGGKNFVYPARALIDVIDAFNEVAENVTRLSAYISSRQEGNTLLDAINHAKNITINFNQKGAGRSVGKNAFEKFIFSMAGWVRPLYLFSNAAIQALNNIVGVSIKHPKKVAAIVASYSLAGFLVPLFTAAFGGDDGEDDYMKLSDWERQNNLCVRLPNGSFLKIPLPQELRVFYRLGDNIYHVMRGKKDMYQTFLDTLFAFSDLLPMSPMGVVDASWAELAPDFIRPFAQIYGTNTSFTGSKIYNEWANENMPGYLKARTNKKGEYYAPQFLVDWFRYLDHMTGGDSVKKGIISLNPDITNHLLRGYFGGLYTLAEQGIGFVSEVYNFTQTGDFEIKVRETPLRTFYVDKNDLRIESSGISSTYYRISDKVSEARRRDKGYYEKVKNGEMSLEEYSRKVQELNMGNVNYLNERIKEVKRIERQMKEMTPEQQKDAEVRIFELKKQIVEESQL